MEYSIATHVGPMSIINVNGTISNYTMFVTSKNIVVAPYHDFTVMALEWEMAGFYSTISPCQAFGANALEIKPLLNKTGWDFKTLVKDILKTC